MKDKFSILTQKCNIRDVRLSDDEQIFEAMACPEVASMHSGGFADISDTRAYIDVLTKEYDGGKFRTLAIADRQSDILLGCITIGKHKYFPCAELGYWIAEPHRNKGYMTEAVSTVIKYGFSNLGLIRIQACHSVNNPASGRVLEKAGMMCEGILRLYNGRSDEKMYAVINTDKLPD
jgi:[ribosomal protein S5]-alanine N-acetyltransferase